MGVLGPELTTALRREKNQQFLRRILVAPLDQIPDSVVIEFDDNGDFSSKELVDALDKWEKEDKKAVHSR